MSEHAAAAALAEDVGTGKGDGSGSARQWARIFERRCKPGETTGVGKEVSAILKFLDVADGQNSGAGASNTGDIAFALANVLSYYAPATAEQLTLDRSPTQGTGLVTKWFATRGFGFIKSDDNSEDLFAHMTEIEGKFNALVIGKTVSFTRAFNSKRGNFQATKISGEACVRAKMSNRSRGICFDFQKGTCTRGNMCRFTHTRGRGRGRRGGRRGGRGRGYNNRGRGGYNNMAAYPYGGYGAMYMPYGGGYGMGAYGGYDAMYSGYPVAGYGQTGYGGYPPYSANSGSYSPPAAGSSFTPVYSQPTEDGALPSPTPEGSSGDAPPPNPPVGGEGIQNGPAAPPSDEGYSSFSNVAPSF